ncbi:MAG: phosphonate ABC transporter substrate-binding protein [Candidatus Aquicultor sp.]|nr:phosphonate ABC transporter substrate-binding protein [Candidatus Aquicultor sp.]
MLFSKQFKILALLGLLLGLFGFIAGCSGSKSPKEQVEQVKQTNAKAEKEEVKVLRVGLIPAEDSEEMVKKFKPATEYLAKKLNVKVEPYVATDYSGVIEAMRSGKIDVAFFGPFSYVLAVDKAGAEAFAVGVGSDGKSTYQSMIITRKDSGIKTLEDIKGRDFAFVDPASTSGNLIPRAMFKKAGIDPEKDFKSVSYTGGHDASALAVKNKKVAVAAVNDITYEKMVKEGLIKPEENAIIAKSDPIPGSPISFRGDLSDDLKEKIKKAFLDMHNEAPEALGGYGEIVRYDEAGDGDYDVIREVAKILNLDLKKMK